MELLFTVSLLELFVGGGGRLLEVGPITVRMILFAICLCVGLAAAICRPRKGDGTPLAIGLVIAYLVVHLLALLIGIGRGNDILNMQAELQQSLYWLAAPFLATALHSKKMVLRAAMLARVAGVVLAIAYIAAIAALALGLVDFLTLYAMLSTSGEFAFRSESFFFYKGFLYLCIAALFLLAIPTRFAALWLTIVLIALTLTLTRGFILSTCFAALMLLIALRRWRLLGMATAVSLCMAAFMWIYLPSQDDKVDVKRAASNSQRIEVFNYVVDNATPYAIPVGHGLGTLIAERLNVENTFIWAWWKLGVLGLAFWLMPLVLCLSYFVRIHRDDPNFRLASAYFFSTVLIYLQTMTNPYLNNPIGLSFVLVALFSLRTLSRSGSASPGPQSLSAVHALPVQGQMS